MAGGETLLIALKTGIIGYQVCISPHDALIVRKYIYIYIYRDYLTVYFVKRNQVFLL